jgi:hypothetical protein
MNMALQSVAPFGAALHASASGRYVTHPHYPDEEEHVDHEDEEDGDDVDVLKVTLGHERAEK